MFGKEENIKINQKIISNYLSGKSFKNENFPVASFVIENEIKKFIRIFYFFARTADDIADNPILRPSQKLQILNFFDHIIQSKRKTDIVAISDLISTFKKLKFAKKYSRNLLKAFKLDAKKKRYKNWSELIFYCKYSANPVGRFFIDLSYQKNKKNIYNKEKILKSSDNLCTSLQIINHLQDCKKDFQNLNRVYLPISLFNKYSVDIKNLNSNKSSKKFEKLKNEIVSNVELLLSNSIDGLKLIDIWKLKKETLVIFNIAKRLCFLIKNNDPLKKNIKLSRIDLIFCFIKGIIWD